MCSSDLIGGLLPGLLRAAGLQSVRAHTNDRCIDLAPPYQEPAMQGALRQELEWSAQDVSILTGSRHDTHRLFLAGGGSESAFESAWGVMVRWLRMLEQGVASGTYHAGRGFVLYLVSGRKPG